MPNNLQIEQSTIDFIANGETYQPKAYYVRTQPNQWKEIDIGYGWMIQNQFGKFPLQEDSANFRKYRHLYKNKDLMTAIISQQEAADIVRDVFAGQKNYINKNANFILTQDQFDALFDRSYWAGNCKTLLSRINKYSNDLIGNKDKVREEFLATVDLQFPSAIKNGMGPGLRKRGLKEFDLFYSQLKPESYYTKASKSLTSTKNSNVQNVADYNGGSYNENFAEETIPDRSLQELFDEIDVNLKNIEQDQTDADWGAKSNESERSAWVSLKGFIIYLCSRYAPHVLVPFVELIPQYQMDESKLNQVQEDSRQNIDKVVQDVSSKYLGSLDTQSIKSTRQKLEQAAEKIPGYNETRYNNQVKQFNNLSGKTDLFNLDPFQEDFISINGEKSKSGKASYDKKNVGVRIYGQVVLSPGAEDNELSKAGAIGFEELVIKQGKGQMNGLTLVELKLRDVQGNKFTDINSPWNFLFDARPGTNSGDFLIRYGWSLQLPAYNDVMAQKFWNHPGWKIFGDVIKNKFKKQAEDQQELILVQSLVTDTYNNDGGIDVARIKQEHSNYQTGTTTSSGFMSISLVNPSIETAEDGSLLATIQFLAGGAMTMNCPLTRAVAIKSLFSQPEHQNGCVLTDLLIDFDADQQLNGTLQISDPKLKEKKELQIKNSHIDLGKQDDISSLALILGAQDNQQAGDNALDPNSIKIVLSDDLKKRLFDQNSTETLLSWFTELLRANSCSLLSFAQGAGLSTRQPYVIMCTQAEAQPLKRTSLKQTSQQATIDEILKADEEVFSYRHQGSLCERIVFSQSETPNQYSIAMNFRVAAWMAQSSDSTLTSESRLNILDRKASMVNLFAQMMECEIDVIAHTWISPGINFYIKGQGWNDGKYNCIECTHTLDNTNKFITHIRGIRIPPTSPEQTDNQATNAVITGAKVATKTDIPTDIKPVAPVIKDATITEPIKTDKTNYIIGDRIAKLIDVSSAKTEILPKLVKDTFSSGELLKAMATIDVYPDVNNIFVSIGTFDNFIIQPRIDTLMQSIKLKFPKAKIFIIPGEYGWGNSANISATQLTTYYNRFKELGATILSTTIGPVTQLPIESTPTIIQCSKEIDAICNNEPITLPTIVPISDKSYKLIGFEYIEIYKAIGDSYHSTYSIRICIKTENMWKSDGLRTTKLISDADLKEFMNKEVLLLFKRDGKEVYRESIPYESINPSKNINSAAQLGFFVGSEINNNGNILHTFTGGLPNLIAIYYNKVLIQEVQIPYLSQFTYSG